MERIKVANDTEYVSVQPATLPVALCMDDTCPWKHAADLAEAQSKAYEHVMDSGHVVRLFPASVAYLPVTSSRKEPSA